MKYAMAAVLAAATAAAFAADPAPAQKTFDAKCATCHNKDGKGKAAMAKMFKIDVAALDLTKAEDQKKPDADLVKVITDGKNKMPAFKAKLKGEEIKDVLAYVRALAAPAAK